MNDLAPPADTLLDVRDLRTEFTTGGGVVRAVDGVSWDVRAGETVALVGESGCGKSVSALSIMGLVARPAGRIAGGQILFKGRDLLELPEDDMRRIRGREIAMVFQEPMTSLNPVLTVGRQITEACEIHLGHTEAQARARAIEVLRLVGIPDAERRLRQYPHQFSGGMRQRLMIAIALSCSPDLILADEPTTALDVTIQAQILDLMKELSRSFGAATLIITHNLGVVARYADRVNVMYAGRIVERGTAREIYANPRHPYTLGLLRSVPRLDEPKRERLDPIQGQPPDLTRLPRGCAFAPRCAFAIERCRAEAPPLQSVGGSHLSACWVAQDLPERAALPPQPSGKGEEIPSSRAQREISR
ncbi:ABC transporter ATP-binding protein [Vineibacter terrae]|uniref:ABC transporter ATP-binding protein n=1 Tax=Vineibacter terrae TaxID=2586908 RepID=UPI002E33D8E1|nr:ABC transporter ATP-binding protein [Vineibacter terrae]HEX2887583.1 ABC transporter ATP-binding protein [Vineibacter terrae]